VVGSVGRLRDDMVQIGTASREQSAGIVQVGTSISQLDQTTQQNAALVEQTASASGSLADQARGLLDSVSRFRLPPQGLWPEPGPQADQQAIARPHQPPVLRLERPA
jgi:methyl-accepting chemotaxis protein